MIPSKKDTKMERIKKIIFDVAILVFIGSCAYLIDYYTDADSNAKFYDGIAGLLGGDQDVGEDYPQTYLTKFAALWEQNEDIIGWLSIEGTQVNYPVVQAEDNDFYLRRDFAKQDNKHGVPFADCRVDVSVPSTNIPIYSHNMKDGQMFGELMSYQNLDFYKAHPVVQFDSIYEENQYVIVGMFIASTLEKHGPNFEYHNFVNSTNPEEFSAFASEVMSRSLINTGFDLQPGDKLITLSTCTYDFEEARFAIVARKLREGESAETINTSGAVVNPNPVMPNAYYEAKKIAARVAGVSISPTELFMKPTHTTKLVATVTPATAVNKNVSWSSSDSSVVSVGSDGTITALKGGTAVITVRTEESGFTASATITVVPDGVTNMKFSAPSASIAVGGSGSLMPMLALEPEGVSKEGLKWTSSNPAVLTVAQDGTVQGIKDGNAVVTVTAPTGVQASITVQVGNYVAVTGFSIGGTATVEVGKQTQLRIIYTPENATPQPITWESSVPGVATVDANGLVTAKTRGTTTITAYLTNNPDAFIPAQLTVTVTEPGTISLNKAKINGVELDSLNTIVMKSNEVLEFEYSTNNKVRAVLVLPEEYSDMFTISQLGTEVYGLRLKAKTAYKNSEFGTFQIFIQFEDGSGRIPITLTVQAGGSSSTSSSSSQAQSSSGDSSSSESSSEGDGEENPDPENPEFPPVIP